MTRVDNLATARYLERLSVPWWMWVLTLAFAGWLAAEIGLGAPGLQTWIPLAILPLAMAVGVWWLGRVKIIVDAELHVDDAHIPLSFIAEAIPLDAAGKRLLLGPGADPLAFVIQRPWIRGGVQVVLNDPDDPTPYWFISARHPDQLAQALSTR